MIQFGRYNDLPDSIKSTIPRVPKGKLVRFSVHVKKDAQGKNIMPSMLGVPEKDRVVDPKSGLSYQIANIVSIQPSDSGEQAVMENPFFYKERACQIILDPNKKPKDRDLYEYLWLCNWNGSNPNRDESAPNKYYMIDDIKDANEKTQRTIEKGMAIQAVFNMSHDDLHAYAAMVGIRTKNREDEIIRAEAIEVAERDPKKFHQISIYLKSMGPYVKDVNAAMENRVIQLDTSTHTWKWVDNRQEFFQGFSTMSRLENIKRLAEWLKNEKDGKAIHLSIIEALRPTPPEPETVTEDAATSTGNARGKKGK